VVDPYLSYLGERWNQGCHKARQLYKEIVAASGTPVRCARWKCGFVHSVPMEHIRSQSRPSPWRNRLPPEVLRS
jgi:hypothetical protein